MRAQRIHGTIPERFWPKVDRRADDECWEWTAHKTHDGYGVFAYAGRGHPAHRIAWELTTGLPWPDPLVADHLCRVRSCVNPRHLEPVTQRDNLHRSSLTQAGKTHCPAGHEYTEANIYRRNGRRYCRACRRHPAKIPA